MFDENKMNSSRTRIFETNLNSFIEQESYRLLNNKLYPDDVRKIENISSELRTALKQFSSIYNEDYENGDESKINVLVDEFINWIVHGYNQDEVIHAISTILNSQDFYNAKILWCSAGDVNHQIYEINQKEVQLIIDELTLIYKKHSKHKYQINFLYEPSFFSYQFNYMDILEYLLNNEYKVKITIDNIPTNDGVEGHSEYVYCYKHYEPPLIIFNSYKSMSLHTRMDCKKIEIPKNAISNNLDSLELEIPKNSTSKNLDSSESGNYTLYLKINEYTDSYQFSSEKEYNKFIENIYEMNTWNKNKIEICNNINFELNLTDNFTDSDIDKFLNNIRSTIINKQKNNRIAKMLLAKNFKEFSRVSQPLNITDMSVEDLVLMRTPAPDTVYTSVEYKTLLCGLIIYQTKYCTKKSELDHWAKNFKIEGIVNNLFHDLSIYLNQLYKEVSGLSYSNVKRGYEKITKKINQMNKEIYYD
jgi:hypothetical protein